MEHRLRTREHSISSDITTDSEEGNNNVVLSLEPKSIQPYRSQDEYLYAMKEDLAEWFNALYGLDIGVDDFFERIETGVLICHHANNVNKLIRESELELGTGDRRDIRPDVVYREKNVKAGSFLSRDNVSNFIDWCRALDINEVVRFETDDLVLRKNPRSVVLCLLEVARRGARYGMLAPCLVQLEQEIEAEIAGEPMPFKPQYPVPQIKTVDMMSLDEMVREIAGRCTCPTQFQITRVSEGKYRVGESQTLIFVRILRVHVMVRIGGGWDTLEHYLDKHDPCRCNIGHKTPAKSLRSRKVSMPTQQRPLVDSTAKSFSQASKPDSAHLANERKRSQSLVPGSSMSRDVRQASGFAVPSGGVTPQQIADHRGRRQSIDVVISRTASGRKEGLTQHQNTPTGRVPRSSRPGSAIPCRDRSASQQRDRSFTPLGFKERPSTPVSTPGRQKGPSVGKASRLHKHFHSTGNVNVQQSLSVRPATPSGGRALNVPTPQRQRRQSIGSAVTSSHLKMSAKDINISGRQSPSPERQRSQSVASHPRGIYSRSTPSPEPRPAAFYSGSRGSTPSPEPRPSSRSSVSSSPSKLMAMHQRYQAVNDQDRPALRRDGSSSESSSTRSSPTRTMPKRPSAPEMVTGQDRSRPPSSASLRPRSARSASVGPRESHSDLSRSLPLKASHTALRTLTVTRDESGKHSIEALNKKKFKQPPVNTLKTPKQKTVSQSTPNTPKLRRSSMASSKPRSACDNAPEPCDENLNNTITSSLLAQQSFDHIQDVSPEDIRMNDQMEQLFEALCKQAELERRYANTETIVDGFPGEDISAQRKKRCSSVDDILMDSTNPVTSPSVSPTRYRNAAIVTPMPRSRSPQNNENPYIEEDLKKPSEINQQNDKISKIPTRSKARRDPRDGTPTRIPLPRGKSSKSSPASHVEPRGHLSRFDSGVDIDNITQTELSSNSHFNDEQEYY